MELSTMPWHGQLGDTHSWNRADKKIVLWELIDLEVLLESPGEDIWVLVRETLVENLGLESPMSDNLKP